MGAALVEDRPVGYQSAATVATGAAGIVADDRQKLYGPRTWTVSTDRDT